jgi:hypothetical protein
MSIAKYRAKVGGSTTKKARKEMKTENKGSRKYAKEFQSFKSKKGW